MLDVHKAKRAEPRGEDTTARSPEACDAQRGRPMLWMPMQTPHGIPRYYRHGAGKYSLRRVMEPKGNTNVMETKWALYCKESRVHELQAMHDRDAAMEQAENWLEENGLVPRAEVDKTWQIALPAAVFAVACTVLFVRWWLCI